MEKYLVIVESPTKAKTIRKFLPKNYIVEASMGHVRDLPQSASDIPTKLKKEDWAKLGVNVDKDFEPLYIIPKGKSKIVRELKKKLKEVDALYLATDEDREGESISWHLLELLQPKVPVKRMVFHEITKSAINKALEDCREVDERLVKAQEARRIVDRLYGYTLSPLIWKKIAYGLSAGRVQSTGLKLLSERENERVRFKQSVYWGAKANLEPDNDKTEFEARFMAWNDQRLVSSKDFDSTTGELKNKDAKIFQEDEIDKVVESLKNVTWEVTSIDDKESSSHPTKPFITSTLQQEGNRKLNMSARQTMRTAQKLYENGLITYMRTDSPNLSSQAIGAARAAVEELYGKEYLSDKPRQYAAKTKGAQEAHEAIRPAGESFVHPKDSGLTGQEKALYELIWKRTMATQMKEAKKLSQVVKIKAGDAEFQANGTRIVFPGFLRVYVEGKDDPSAALDDKEVILPKLTVGQKLKLSDLEPTRHQTNPPPRFTEASIVQRLEKEGIGRPSTYATIISTILDRGYARKDGKALIPTFTGMAVAQLLNEHFDKLVDYGFTSEMEASLDAIADGEKEWLDYLKKFYKGNGGLKALVDRREKEIKPDQSRCIQLPQIDGIDVRVGRYGPYIIANDPDKKSEEIHASIPEEIAPADLTQEDIDELIEASKNGPTPIGVDPKTGENVYCLTGRYGAYLQLGEKTDDNPKPKRSSLPKPLTPKTVTLEEALKLLELPRELGNHPETGKPILANNGRFGPYVMHDGDFRSLKKEDDLYEVDLKRALEILAMEKKSRRGAKTFKEFANHPKTDKKIAVMDGKYGLYIKYASKNITIPEDLRNEETINKWELKDVVEIIDKAKKK